MVPSGMKTSLAVIIPTVNEETRVADAIRSAAAAGADEVVVVDGASSDGTVAAALAAGARVLISSGPLRARQLNEGAAASGSDVFLFLHADTLLPENAGQEVRRSIKEGAEFGAFSIGFLENRRRLRIAAWLINARSRIRFSPWGDQAQFIRREAFLEVGGFREIPLMEDLDLAARMRRRGKVVLLGTRALTSGRRFARLGVLRTMIMNWILIAAFRCGVDPERLARIYRRKAGRQVR
jgi:rSAM/selenodomain-associated transferase 2